MPFRLLALVIATSVFLLDRVTKVLIQQYVSTWDTYTIIPGFLNIIHTENPGAAFSLFADSPSEWRTFFLIGISAAALVLIAVLLWRPSGRVDSPMLGVSLALIFGGALGNLYDRIVRGAVTDFIDMHIGAYHWPTFNVADSAITVGAALMLLEMFRSRRPAEKKPKK